METIIGIAIGLMIAILGRAMRFDEDASFYPVILIVIAFYYVLFSILDGGTNIVIFELLIALAFTTLAFIGPKKSVYIVPAGIIFHGIYDVFHDAIFINKGVPLWWPAFCAAVDISIGFLVIYFAIKRSNDTPRPTQKSRG